MQAKASHSLSKR